MFENVIYSNQTNFNAELCVGLLKLCLLFTRTWESSSTSTYNNIQISPHARISDWIPHWHAPVHHTLTVFHISTLCIITTLPFAPLLLSGSASPQHAVHNGKNNDNNNNNDHGDLMQNEILMPGHPSASEYSECKLSP